MKIINTFMRIVVNISCEICCDLRDCTTSSKLHCVVSAGVSWIGKKRVAITCSSSNIDLAFLTFRAVTESINHLLSICTTSAPGQKECDNALRQMQVMTFFVCN